MFDDSKCLETPEGRVSLVKSSVLLMEEQCWAIFACTTDSVVWTQFEKDAPRKSIQEELVGFFESALPTLIMNCRVLTCLIIV